MRTTAHECVGDGPVSRYAAEVDAHVGWAPQPRGVIGDALVEPAEQELSIPRDPVRRHTVTVTDGGERIVTDGPFAETREVLGGYYLLDELTADVRLRAHHLLPAARADLLRRLGRRAGAAAAYRQALALVGNEPEHRFLLRRTTGTE